MDPYAFEHLVALRLAEIARALPPAEAVRFIHLCQQGQSKVDAAEVRRVAFALLHPSATNARVGQVEEPSSAQH